MDKGGGSGTCCRQEGNTWGTMEGEYFHKTKTELILAQETTVEMPLCPQHLQIVVAGFSSKIENLLAYDVYHVLINSYYFLFS